MDGGVVFSMFLMTIFQLTPYCRRHNVHHYLHTQHPGPSMQDQSSRALTNHRSKSKASCTKSIAREVRALRPTEMAPVTCTVQYCDVLYALYCTGGCVPARS